MESKFEKYMATIGMTDVAIARASSLIEFAELISKKKTEEIFVTDILDDSGTRRYENIWIFSDSTISECNRFMTSENLDFIRRDMNPEWIGVQWKSYNFLRSTPKSSLAFHIRWNVNTQGMLSATSNNCNVLFDLVRRRFIGRMMG